MALSPPPLKVFNSLTQQIEPFVPIDPSGKKVSMYVCGPTVYDFPHLGHARCYITWDVLFRMLLFLGFDVSYARNITDVDDKILQRAKEQGISPESLAQKFSEIFNEDMATLHILTPTHTPQATHHIQTMHNGIQALLDKQMAYVTPEGTVYYRVSQKKDYGKLSRKPLDDLRAGARVDVDPHKESPLDFALWKHVNDDDAYAWDSPWGRGRPGWHMECSAMNMAIFGPQIDLHAGGADLIFPHHENEIAQSEAWSGHTPFVKYWLHNGFVNVSGEKMSKSLGNFSTIRQVLERYAPDTIRYFLLTNHYRMPVDFNDEALQGAQNRINKIQRTFRQIHECFTLTPQPGVLSIHPHQVPSLQESLEVDHPEVQRLLQEFVGAMCDDFNTPQALAALNEMISILNRLLQAIGDDPSNGSARKELVQAWNSFQVMWTVLGFHPPVNEGADGEDIDFSDHVNQELESLKQSYLEAHPELEVGLDSDMPLIVALIQIRQTAKGLKNWAVADGIRNSLKTHGIQLLDHKDGTTGWERLTPVV